MQSIAHWLNTIGLGQYAQRFADNDIDASILRDLTDEDLEKVGVSLGHRKRMLRAIAQLDEAACLPKLACRIEAERRQLTVMFADLVGSTVMSTRLDPEDLREIIGAYHRCCGEQIAGSGGFVARYMGDGILAYFGYPQAHEDDAERAVRAGLALVAAVAKLGDGAGAALRMRIGIATGLVVVGDFAGEAAAQERDVVGETPNLAARLQALAQPGMIIIDASTRRLLANLFEYHDLGAIEVKGFAAPVQAHQVIRQSAVESRFEALRATGTPFVGRDEEMELLVRRWRRATTGEGQIVLISGEPGIGKSRLVAALQETIAASKAPYERLESFCSPHHQDSALHPVITRLERAAGFGHEDEPDVRIAKLEALLAAGHPTAEEFSLIANLLGLTTGHRYPQLDLTPQLRRERMLGALLRGVEAMANARPVLGVLEDAHWADPTTLELLDLLAERVESLPLLFVVTHRPEFRAPWAGQAHVTEMRLSRLGRRDKAALIEQVAGGAGTLPPDVMQEIADRTDGVPLFIEEMTRAVLEAGGEVRLQTTFLAGATVPETLYASLTARLDRLGASARQVSQAGAAIGREFGHDLLAAIAGVPDDTLGSALQRLEGARLIHRRGVPPEATYSFRHALLRDAAYGMLLREPRRALHARIAEAILRLRPDTAESEPQLLAWHYTGAGLASPAIMYWQQAGERNVAQYANLEAIGYCQRALDLVETLPPGTNRDQLEADLRLAQVVPLSAIHGVGSQAVETCAARVEALRDRLADWPGAFAARKVVWHTCLMRQPVPRALALGHEVLSLAERSGDPAHIAIACRALGYSYYIAGEQGEADPVLARGIALADGLAAVYGEDPRIICRINRGMVLCFLGYPETALRIAHEGLARARAGNNPHAVAWSLVSLADIHIFLGNAGGAEQAAAEAIDVARQHRLVQWLARAPQRRGWALCQLGNTHEGLALLEEGLRRQHATGHMLGTTRANCYLAEGCLLAGRPEAALGHIEAAHRHAETYGEHYMSAEMHRLHAEVLHIQGIPASEIEGHLREALNIARDQGARLWEMRAATCLARFWHHEGKRDEARELLAAIYGWFTEGFDNPHLKEAKALLDELS